MNNVSGHRTGFAPYGVVAKNRDERKPKKMAIEIKDNPITDGQPVSGICEGRIVAYWPTKEEIAGGLRAVGSGEYIPAIVVAYWGQKDVPAVIPCANIRLMVDGCNIRNEAVEKFATDGCKGSVRYSMEPAYGCWTWIPKA